MTLAVLWKTDVRGARVKAENPTTAVMEAGDHCVLLGSMEMGRKVVIQDNSFPIWQFDEAYKLVLE